MPSRQVVKYFASMLDKKVNFNFNNLGARHPDASLKLRAQDGWEAHVYFLPDEPIPAHYTSDEKKRVTGFLPSRQYTWTLDILRNEGPTTFYWDESRFEIRTGPEQPGAFDTD